MRFYWCSLILKSCCMWTITEGLPSFACQHGIWISGDLCVAGSFTSGWRQVILCFNWSMPKDTMIPLIGHWGSSSRRLKESNKQIIIGVLIPLPWISHELPMFKGKTQVKPWFFIVSHPFSNPLSHCSLQCPLTFLHTSCSRHGVQQFFHILPDIFLSDRSEVPQTFKHFWWVCSPPKKTDRFTKISNGQDMIRYDKMLLFDLFGLYFSTFRHVPQKKMPGWALSHGDQHDQLMGVAWGPSSCVDDSLEAHLCQTCWHDRHLQLPRMTWEVS